MTVKELKDAIGKFPDDFDVVIDVQHDQFDWQDTATFDIEVCNEDLFELHITAFIQDEL